MDGVRPADLRVERRVAGMLLVVGWRGLKRRVGKVFQNRRVGGSRDLWIYPKPQVDLSLDGLTVNHGRSDSRRALTEHCRPR